MKEDLAEWLNRLYPDLDLNTDNFFGQLETGAIICRHANQVTQMGRNNMLEQSTTDSGNEGIEDSFNDLEIGHHHHRQQQHRLSSLSPEYDEDDHQQSSFSLMSSGQRHSLASQQRLSLTGSLTSNGSGYTRLADQNINWFRVKMISYKTDACAGTFFARDNICQFILWCRSLNIRECLLFETDDLVARKNEKSFILCLLEVARIGFKVGMPTPLIIQLEQEIDREIENDAKLQKQLEEEQARRARIQADNCASVANVNNDNDEENLDLHVAGHEGLLNDKNNNGNDSDSGVKGQNVGQETCDKFLSQLANDKEQPEQVEEKQVKDEEEEEIDYCEEDIGPKPQVITNDLLSLHEKVSEVFIFVVVFLPLCVAGKTKLSKSP